MKKVDLIENIQIHSQIEASQIQLFLMDPNERLDALINEALISTKDLAGFTIKDIIWVCTGAQEVLASESSLLSLEAPIKICGDLHGMYTDLIKAFKHGGLPSHTKWLFLGDYVDRGPQSIEVVCLLFAMKMRYPDRVFLLRGNHESNDMSSIFGFSEECSKKLNTTMWNLFCDVFNVLPLAAVINKAFFCVHGGISPDLGHVAQISRIKRPVTIPKTGLICDLLWSDPDINVSYFEDSDRGNTVMWGLTAARKFLTINKLQLIIRGHQVAAEGYNFPFTPDHNVVTVFTSSCHSPDNIIRACYMTIEEDLKYSFTLLPLDTPAIPHPSSPKNGEKTTIQRRQMRVAGSNKLPLQKTSITSSATNLRKSLKSEAPSRKLTRSNSQTCKSLPNIDNVRRRPLAERIYH
ncbi:Serine/threonine-protein phosphatase PP1-2 [Tritrichomonas foetus]|uniref:Serine/threonine-protein phosphatase n=1 Tax=Tritrichomonas foetus TaxID=1144522 RepID=A0A1J4JR58_9EUKA|nr:Serine/threonine-protein phosphatase PP1-2 [Tritrichomonas foetus]|eukprot:OHT01601.1 Serine/threonine-protein phosphatase PP1-2 [Tritrichomonas foetus]